MVTSYQAGDARPDTTASRQQSSVQITWASVEQQVNEDRQRLFTWQSNVRLSLDCAVVLAVRRIYGPGADPATTYANERNFVQKHKHGSAFKLGQGEDLLRVVGILYAKAMELWSQISVIIRKDIFKTRSNMEQTLRYMHSQAQKLHKELAPIRLAYNEFEKHSISAAHMLADDFAACRNLSSLGFAIQSCFDELTQAEEANKRAWNVWNCLSRQNFSSNEGSEWNTRNRLSQETLTTMTECLDRLKGQIANIEANRKVTPGKKRLSEDTLIRQTWNTGRKARHWKVTAGNLIDDMNRDFGDIRSNRSRS